MRRRDLSDVLSEIRGKLERNPPSERKIEQEAYFAWQRGGERLGDDQNDWFNARRELETDAYFDLLDEAMRHAANNLDFELQLGLSVVRNVAIHFNVRPMNINPSTLLEGIHGRRLMMIVASVGRDLCFRFNGRYAYARNVEELVRQLYENEYWRYKGC